LNFTEKVLKIFFVIGFTSLELSLWSAEIGHAKNSNLSFIGWTGSLALKIAKFILILQLRILNNEIFFDLVILKTLH
jgi:hypothetical protein